MQLSPYRIPEGLLDRLAAGGGGAEVAAHLAASQYNRHLLLVRGVVEQASEAGQPHAEVAYDLLADIAKHSAHVVEKMIRYPAVGAWARRTLRELVAGKADPLAPAQLGAVAAVAASRAGVRCRIEVPAPGGRIMLPSLGLISLPTDDDQLVELEVSGEEFGRRIQVLHHLRSKEIDLVVDDLDPHRWPGPTVIDGRLGPDELRLWQACLHSAWEILSKHHWTIAAEVGAMTAVLTPIRAADGGRDSATSRDTFGTVALSTPPDGRWLASTFAHEIQHAKLNAILDVVDLTLPDDRRYYAPWRGDPRPLSGLLHGVYAHVGLAGFWRRQREFEDDLRPHIEFARWRAAAVEVTGTILGSGRLTSAGERFVTLLSRTLTAWTLEPVPQAALEVAEHEAAEHRAAWTALNRATEATETADRSPSRSALP